MLTFLLFLIFVVTVFAQDLTRQKKKPFTREQRAEQKIRKPKSSKRKMNKETLSNKLISKVAAHIEQDSTKPLDERVLRKIAKRALGKHKLAEKARFQKITERVLTKDAKFGGKNN